MPELPEDVAVEKVSDADLDVVFPGTWELARRYAELLVEQGIPQGLLGPREAGVLWSRHILNCAVVGELIPTGASIVDVGSGAGLPGIALALACPASKVTLVEPLLRRSRWLSATVTALGIADQVSVVRGRIEEQRGQCTGDIVTSRAVSSLDKLITWCKPAVRPSGRMLALRGEHVGQEIAAATDMMRKHRCQATVHTCGSQFLHPPTTVADIRFSLQTVRPRKPVQRSRGAS